MAIIAGNFLPLPVTPKETGVPALVNHHHTTEEEKHSEEDHHGVARRAGRATGCRVRGRRVGTPQAGACCDNARGAGRRRPRTPALRRPAQGHVMKRTTTEGKPPPTE